MRLKNIILKAVMLLSFTIILLPQKTTTGNQNKTPDNAHAVSWDNGWECDDGYIQRGSKCIHITDATDKEIRKYMIESSIASYSGNCPCPYNTDRRGHSCGKRSAYSKPGGYAPLCYERDISDEEVKEFRMRYSR